MSTKAAMFVFAIEQKDSDLRRILEEQKDKRGIPTRDARLPPDTPIEKSQTPNGRRPTPPRS
jgi:hypothetical protein